MIFVGRLTSHKYFDKLTKTVQDKEESNEEIEFFLKYITLGKNKAAVEQFADDRRYRI
ncbi:unnamed protein product, partial [Rotaria sordida]